MHGVPVSLVLGVYAVGPPATAPAVYLVAAFDNGIYNPRVQGDTSHPLWRNNLRGFGGLQITPNSAQRGGDRYRGLSVDAGDAVPEQVHLALADARPREKYAMSVSWLTWAETRSRVFWGRSEKRLIHEAKGEATSE